MHHKQCADKIEATLLHSLAGLMSRATRALVEAWSAAQPDNPEKKLRTNCSMGIGGPKRQEERDFLSF
jgi:hypothetical protein